MKCKSTRNDCPLLYIHYYIRAKNLCEYLIDILVFFWQMHIENLAKFPFSIDIETKNKPGIQLFR